MNALLRPCHFALLLVLVIACGAPPASQGGASGGNAAGAPNGGAEPFVRTKRPKPANIVFILSDDQRNDTLGIAGHPVIKSPNLDAMAKKGVHFRNAFVTTSICAASRASLFTGVTERTHGYTFGEPPVSKALGNDSYPKRLRDAGYKVAHVGKYGVKSQASSSDLFDEFSDFDRPYWNEQGQHITNKARDLALAFLSKQTPDQPFALQVSFSAAHADDGRLAIKDHFAPATEELELYKGLTLAPPRLNDPAIFEAMPDFLKSSENRERFFWRWDTEEKYQGNMANYFRLISGIDRVVGDIQKKLSERGVADNTVIVFSGDNGYYMGDRGFSGKWTHFEQSLRVPLIIYDPMAPAAAQGITTDELALNVDVPATILDLAGIAVPKHYQGTTLAETVGWEGNKNTREDFLCEHHLANNKIPCWEGIRNKRYKYATYYNQTPPYEYLHDLQDDPDELVNLAKSPAHATIKAELIARLADYKTRFPAAPSLK